MMAVESSPTQVNWLVVGAEPVTSIDVTSADTLDELDHTLAKAGIRLCIAEMKDPVKDKLKRFGLFSQFGEDRFLPRLARPSAVISKPTPLIRLTGRIKPKQTMMLFFNRINPNGN